MSSSLSSFLSQTTIRDVVGERRSIVVLSSCTSIEDALRIMSDHRILSAPVIDSDTGSYMGFVDMLDVVYLAIEMYSEGNSTENVQWSSWCRDIATLKHRGVRFGIKPIKSILNKSRNDPFRPVYHSGTITQTIEEFFAKGVHRVPVMDDTDHITNVISQSDVLRLISNQLSKLPDVRTKTVDQLNLGTRQVISMSYDAEAIHAFYQMYYNKVSAVAIMSNEELIANISASDIRGLSRDSFEQLLDPVLVFLTRRANPLINGERTVLSVRTPATCTLNTTFENVVLKLATYRLHHLWVVDDRSKPIGLVSLTDVCRMVLA